MTLSETLAKALDLLEEAYIKIDANYDESCKWIDENGFKATPPSHIIPLLDSYDMHSEICEIIEMVARLRVKIGDSE